MTNVYETLQDELRISKAIIAGSSMGGGIAQRITLSYPSHILTLMLMSTTTLGGTPESKAAVLQFHDKWYSTPVPTEQIMNATIQSFGGDVVVDSPRAREIKHDWVENHAGEHRLDEVMESG